MEWGSRSQVIGFVLVLAAFAGTRWPLVAIERATAEARPGQGGASGRGEAKDEDEEDDELLPLPPPPSRNLELPPDIDAKKADQLRGLIDDFRRAEDIDTRGDKMRKIATELARLKPRLDIPLVSYYLGRCAFHFRDLAKAEAELTAAVTSHPSFYEAHTDLAAVYILKNDLPAAIDHFDKALAAYPTYLPALEQSGLALAQHGDLEKARARLEEAQKYEVSEDRVQWIGELREAIEGTGWKETFSAESDHYRVRTSLSKERADALVADAEAAYRYFVRALPSLDRPGAKLEIFLYPDGSECANAGAAGEDGGIYSTLFGSVKICEGAMEEETETTIKRRGIEQLVRRSVRDVPLWLVEGLKEHFQQVSLALSADEDAWVRPPILHYETILMGIRRARVEPLQSLLLMNPKDFASNHALNLAHAWGMVYFCLLGGNPKYRAALDAYVGALAGGKSIEEAHEASFGQLEARRLESDFKKYIADELPKLLRGR